MNRRLSVIMVTLNSEELLHESLESVKKIADEIVVIDAGSRDGTIDILKEYRVRLYKTTVNNLGKNKAKALSLAKNDLILLLDSDEVVSTLLVRTIDRIKKRKSIVDGYIIPFQNHFLGKRLKYGGENYSMLRLGNRKKLKLRRSMVHESLEIRSNKIEELKSPILHYSYRSLSQMLDKFTRYAVWEAKEKYKRKERSSVKKIILYPVHMFWARFIKDRGYKDGMFRIPLDLGFAYMEFITYVVLAYKNIKL